MLNRTTIASSLSHTPKLEVSKRLLVIIPSFTLKKQKIAVMRNFILTNVSWIQPLVLSLQHSDRNTIKIVFGLNTWCTQTLHLSQKTISLPSSPSGERHTSQTTSSSYSMPRPSWVSMACCMFCWHLLSSSTSTCSMVSSSSSGSAETHKRNRQVFTGFWHNGRALWFPESMEGITKSSHKNCFYCTMQNELLCEWLAQTHGFVYNI